MKLSKIVIVIISLLFYRQSDAALPGKYFISERWKTKPKRIVTFS